MKGVFWVIFTVGVLWACFAGAAPTPAIVQRPTLYTLDTEFQHPLQVTMRLKNGGYERYWYIILTVTNNTGQDVDFYPECELMTDTFEVLGACEGVPVQVFEKIKLRHQLQYPFLESLDEIDNRMLQGEDNTKDIAIIWRDFDPDAKAIKLFIAGLSNETAVVEHPTAKDQNGNPQKIFLRKTLELDYKLGGDPAYRSNVKMTFEGEQWVMR